MELLYLDSVPVVAPDSSFPSWQTGRQLMGSGNGFVSVFWDIWIMLSRPCSDAWPQLSHIVVSIWVVSQLTEHSLIFTHKWKAEKRPGKNIPRIKQNTYIPILYTLNIIINENQDIQLHRLMFHIKYRYSKLPQNTNKLTPETYKWIKWIIWHEKIT